MASMATAMPAMMNLRICVLSFVGRADVIGGTPIKTPVAKGRYARSRQCGELLSFLIASARNMRSERSARAPGAWRQHGPARRRHRDLRPLRPRPRALHDRADRGRPPPRRPLSGPERRSARQALRAAGAGPRQLHAHGRSRPEPLPLHRPARRAGRCGRAATCSRPPRSRPPVARSRRAGARSRFGADRSGSPSSAPGTQHAAADARGGVPGVVGQRDANRDEKPAAAADRAPDAAGEPQRHVLPRGRDDARKRPVASTRLPRRRRTTTVPRAGSERRETSVAAARGAARRGA